MRTPQGPWWWRWAVAGVLAGAAVLRLVSAAGSPLTKDEIDQVDAAWRWGTAPPSLVAPPPSGAQEAHPGAGVPQSETPRSAARTNHPLLATLLNHAMLRMGFRTPLGVRLPFVTLSVVGLACAYLLACRGFGRLPALLAVALLALDPFHLVRSRTASEAVALAFVAPALYVFHRAVTEDRRRLMLLTGALLAVGYYAKEDTLLLVPALALYLAARRSRRRWLSRKEPYLALLILAVLVSGDAYLNAIGASQNLSRLAERAAGVGLTLRATSLYLGELLVRMAPNPAEFVWVQDRWSWEVPAMNWVAGLVCLAAVVYATGRYRDELTSLLLWVFWVVFTAASVVAPTHGFFELDLKKWAGASLIPAAILAGDLLYRRTRHFRPGQALAAVLLVYLAWEGTATSLVRDNVYSLPPEVAAARPPRQRSERSPHPEMRSPPAAHPNTRTAPG